MRLKYLNINNHFFSQLIFAAIIFLTLTGCTVPVDVYLRNLTNSDQEVYIQFRNNSDVNLEFLYSKSIDEPSHDLFKKFSEQVIGKIVGDNSTVVVDIPPNCILFLEKTMNFRSLKYKSVKINSKVDILEANGAYDNEYKSKKEGLSKYSIWYDIEY